MTPREQLVWDTAFASACAHVHSEMKSHGFRDEMMAGLYLLQRQAQIEDAADFAVRAHRSAIRNSRGGMV